MVDSDNSEPQQEPGPGPDLLGVRKGVLEVLDAAGNVLPPADGELSVSLWQGKEFDRTLPNGATIRESESRRLAVQGGRFALGELEGFETMTANPFDAPGWSARPDRNSGDLDLPGLGSDLPGSSLIVRLRRVEALTLHVVSADTGLDLDQVEVLRSTGPGFSGTSDPGAHDTVPLAHGVRSPIQIGPEVGVSGSRHLSRLGLLVRARGHAWQYVELALPAAAVHTVELTPTCSLDLELIGPLQELTPNLWVRMEGRPGIVYEERYMTEQQVRINELPAGRLTVYLNNGGKPYGSPVLASAEVEVDAGQVGFARLEFEPLDLLERVAVSGEILVPEAWSPFDPRLTLRVVGGAPDGRDSMPRTQATFEPEALDGIWHGRFEFEDVYPAASVLAMDAIGWSEVVEIQPGGLAGLKFEVGPPIQVELVFIDADTGALLIPEYVSLGRTDLDAEFDDEVGRLRCSPGPQQLLVQLQGYGVRFIDIEVPKSGGRLSVPLQREGSITVKFVRGDAPAFLSIETRLEVRDAEGQRVQTWAGHAGDELSAGLPDRGRYTITIQGLNGFEMVAPFELDTTDLLEHERTVELVPLR